jgi:hypothetical protein
MKCSDSSTTTQARPLRLCVPPVLQPWRHCHHFITRHCFTRYTSCDKLLVVYPSGVARDPAAADAAQAAGMNRPTVNRGTYKANAGRLDRDRDGVACEQPA